ncbi:Receptor-mediated endocytosis protein 6 homolog [Strongyloides ratti]|uniref:Receptor-mediated endocytosis protein 6 homolog n=1 Tax=Strongyloides ratti TaxID=34506 RepID=A0A090KUL5_STRRB|nr:Receptor-mediated endocytosis protein 6 homolog [Strongyloides ratti]CEF61111.1 Receptor-mediated endocytosis protein 6 homolog [Strongyloides ratti]
MDSFISLNKLCEKLGSEKLLISNELKTIQKLHEQINDHLSNLQKSSWLNKQEQFLLYNLIHHHPSISPDNCSRLIEELSSSNFSEAWKGFGQHHTTFTQIFNILYSSPQSVAELLAASDNIEKVNGKYSTDDLVRSIYSSLFLSCIFPLDEALMLKIFKHLIPLQIISSNDPRKVLRRGNRTISKLFRLFFDGLYPAKIFITSALHDAILEVLSGDSLFLDVDPTKLLQRFSKSMRESKFGKDETSFSYLEKVTIYRKEIVQKLVHYVKKFIDGINQAMICFPNSLTWFVKEIKNSFCNNVNNKILNNEITLICTEIIFTHFICPAISNPEYLGIISDTPISNVARFNLMQIGQIIQSLAMYQFEKPSFNTSDVFDELDVTSMSNIVTSILNSPNVPCDTYSINIINNEDGDELYQRKHFTCSIFDAKVIISYLRTPCIEAISDQNIRRDMRNLLLRMPSEFTTEKITENLNVISNISRTDSPSRTNKLRSIADRGKRLLHNHPSKLSSFVRSDSVGHNLSSSPVQCSPSLQNISNIEIDIDKNMFEVVILPLGDIKEPVGLLSEEKFMSSLHFNKKYSMGNKLRIEKKARFVTNTESLISDQTIGSIGVDCGEEENPSICSSLDDNLPNDNDNVDGEDISTLPDNFSNNTVSDDGNSSSDDDGDDDDDDDVDNNVDGDDVSVDRRTSISMVQHEQNDAPASSTRAAVAPDPIPVMPYVPVTVRKQNPEGLEEQFGKFGIPEISTNQKNKDDTYSLVSDSWSTDVVASDNEGISEKNDRSTRGSSSNTVHSTPLQSGNLLVPNQNGLEDKSDTWSLDALASDSEADPNNTQRRQNESDTVNNLQDNSPTDDISRNDNGLLNENNSQQNKDSGSLIRRQSSGSSFYSKSEIDADPISNFSNNTPIKNESQSNRIRTGFSNIKNFSNAFGMQKKKTEILLGIQKKAGQAMNTIKNSIVQSDHNNLPSSKNNLNSIYQSNSSNQLIALGEDASSSNNHKNNCLADDILDKYKNMRIINNTEHNNITLDNNINCFQNEDDEQKYYDENNILHCKAFIDAKKKLRMTLSGVDNLQSNKLNITLLDFDGDIFEREKSFLIGFLNLILAEAINNNNKIKAAQIRETIRCLSIFSGRNLRDLIKILKDEYRKRSCYHEYLQQSKLTLLHLENYLSKLVMQIKNEKIITEDYLFEILVRTFMSKHETLVNEFIKEIKTLVVMDEKAETLNNFLNILNSQVLNDDMWKGASQQQLKIVTKYIERSVYASIYSILMFPNNEVDIMRDEVFHNSVKIMSETINLDHPDVRIPKRLQGECPWPSAQSELSIINAYKTPKDKIQCIVRCCEEIEHLICLSSSASADDLTPVLVYVIIQSNPNSLLSTIQLIDGFYSKYSEGKEAYLWAQFTSAVEYIKSLVNKHL